VLNNGGAILKRADDFQTRRQHLAGLTDTQLENRFWELAEKIVNPLIDLASKQTSPSVERSVLLRMGFNSLEAKAIVDGVMDRGLLAKGAGHVVLKVAKSKNIDIREAGRALAQGQHWDEAVALFKGGAK